MDETKFIQSLEWWHVVGGLASLAIGLFGMGFRQWSRTLEDVTKSWGEKFDAFVKRQERHEAQLEKHISELHIAHLKIIDRIARVEGRLAAKAGGHRWYDPKRQHDDDNDDD